jgi:hypothetical protein
MNINDVGLLSKVKKNACIESQARQIATSFLIYVRNVYLFAKRMKAL